LLGGGGGVKTKKRVSEGGHNAAESKGRGRHLLQFIREESDNGEGVEKYRHWGNRIRLDQRHFFYQSGGKKGGRS